MHRRLPSLDEARCTRVRNALYDSVGDLEAWPAALRAVAEVLGATGVVMSVPSFDARLGYSFDSLAVNVDFELATRYAVESQSLDPWTRGALAQGLARPGLVLRGGDMCSREDVERSSWKGPVVDAAEMGDVLTASLAMPGMSVNGGLSIAVFHRHSPCEPFEREAADRLRLFVGDIGLAARAAFALRAARRESELAYAALDLIDCAIIRLNPSGGIEHANLAAEHLLTRGGAITSRQGRLEATVEHERSRLAELLAVATAKSAGGACVLGGGDDKMVVNVMPAPPGNVGRGLLIAARPLRAQVADSETVRVALKLTVAESRVACGVGQGATPIQIAADLGLSPETVRSHLKSVASKLGVSKQAEVATIVRAILR